MAAAALTLAGCGLPNSGDFEAIPENEIPKAIRDTLPPTTTTTTTTTPTTVATTIIGPTTTVRQTTTTTTTVPTEPVQLFYVQGSKIRAITFDEKVIPVTVKRKLLDLTERVGMISPEARLATVLPLDAALESSEDRGAITVELGTTIDSIVPEDQPLFFAQIVLTILAPTQLGQVTFTQRGIPYPAVKGDGTVLEPGAPAAWEDYADLIVDQDDPSSTTTTSSSTTSTTVARTTTTKPK